MAGIFQDAELNVQIRVRTEVMMDLLLERALNSYLGSKYTAAPHRAWRVKQSKKCIPQKPCCETKVFSKLILEVRSSEEEIPVNSLSPNRNI